MIYSYYDKSRINNVSLISNVKFAFIKLKRIWFLHILCTSVMLVLGLLGSHAEALWRVIVKFLLNTVWIQEWFPIRGRSPDIISWFICTIFLAILFFLGLYLNSRKIIAFVRLSIILVSVYFTICCCIHWY